MRHILIGDVHGCYAELLNLMDKIGEIGPEDVLIFLGDLTDRGPKSYEVMEYVKDLKEKLGNRLVYILGNHDYMMIHAPIDIEEYECWFYNGAKTTKKSLKDHGQPLYAYVDWVRENSVVYYQTPMFDVCHGGSFEYDISKDKVYDLVWDREALTSGLRKGKLIVVGHTPLKYPTLSGREVEGGFKGLSYDEDLTLPKTGMIDIDTGCVYGGLLTAMIIEGDTYRLINVEGRKHHAN